MLSTRTRPLHLSFPLHLKVLEEAGTAENEIHIFRNITESQPLCKILDLNTGYLKDIRLSSSSKSGWDVLCVPVITHDPIVDIVMNLSGVRF